MKGSLFPLFNSHLDLAHHYWKTLLDSRQSPSIIDATCGNGHDALFLAKHCLKQGTLYCLDIQETAITNTKSLLQTHLDPSLFKAIEFIHTSHATFPPYITSCDLIVYNLGYLPGGDKTLTTSTDSTLASITQGLSLLNPGGLISITCYPGHPEGAKEQSLLIEYSKSLSPKDYLVCHHFFANRMSSPNLITIFKRI